MNKISKKLLSDMFGNSFTFELCNNISVEKNIILCLDLISNKYNFFKVDDNLSLEDIKKQFNVEDNNKIIIFFNNKYSYHEERNKLAEKILLEYIAKGEQPTISLTSNLALMQADNFLSMKNKTYEELKEEYIKHAEELKKTIEVEKEEKK